MERGEGGGDKDGLWRFRFLSTSIFGYKVLVRLEVSGLPLATTLRSKDTHVSDRFYVMRDSLGT